MLFHLQRLLRFDRRTKPICLPPLSAKSKLHPQGKVLIAYLRWPFQEGYNAPRARGHTNAFEVMAIAQTYQELGYQVDIIDHDDPNDIPPADYCVAIDLHGQLEGWNTWLPKSCHRLLHATGAHWLVSNHGELERLAAIRDRKGVALLPQRQVPPSRSAAFADQIVVVGNEYTMDTFHFAKKPITRIPLSSAYEFPYPEQRDISLAKKNFLWLGSCGMVHKGLDLVLEAFSKMPQLSLTVCGRPEKEVDFFHLYKQELLHIPNITLHGWIDMASPEFAHLAQTHIGIIYPSCSEGGAGSVIHSMHAGMVPMCTKEASVDLCDFGILIKNGSLDAVMNAAQQFASLSNKEVEERAINAYTYVRKHHTRELFQKNYRSFAEHLLGS